MKKVLITGYAGQDGYFLSHILHDKGYKVFGFDMPHTIHRPNFVDRLTGDMEILKDVKGSIEKVKPHAVYHLAAITNPWDADVHPYRMLRVNVIGTMNVFEAVKDMVPDCKVLYVSSDNVFGNRAPVPQNEETPLRPSDFYGMTKAAGLMLADVYRGKGLHINSVIPFNHTSSIQGHRFLFGQIAKEIVRVCNAILEGSESIPPIVLRSGWDERDFLHAKDVAEAMVIVMEKGNNTDYVVGSGVPLTVEKIMDLFIKSAIKEFGLKIKAYDIKTLVEYKYRYCDGMSPRADTRKIRDLGWKPQIPLCEIIEEMIRSVEIS